MAFDQSHSRLLKLFSTRQSTFLWKFHYQRNSCQKKKVGCFLRFISKKFLQKLNIKVVLLENWQCWVESINNSNLKIIFKILPSILFEKINLTMKTKLPTYSADEILLYVVFLFWVIDKKRHPHQIEKKKIMIQYYFIMFSCKNYFKKYYLITIIFHCD